MSTLLRIEAVNLRWVIDDTEDLSTRRGGSLMLLDAITHLAKLTKNAEQFDGRISPISSGASIGLFSVASGQDAHQIAKEVREVLTTRYRHATFMVDVASDDDFSNAAERVGAANRWRQMRSLSFSSAGLHPADQAAVCGIDDLRPVAREYKYKGKNISISQSCHDRRADGGRRKHDFYRDQLKTLPDIGTLSFTNDFDDLSTAGKQSDYGFLNGKIAVLYADGNDFGGIQHACASDSELSRWDGYVRGQRNTLLAGILEEASNSSDWMTADGKIRLETLLWGGDELMFVVPAWLGLDLAQRFFDLTRDMKYLRRNKDQPPILEEKPLTHGVGLVFCHHNAPISRIQALAKDLAEKCKTISREKNLLAWAILESFDHTGMDLDGYLQRRYHAHLAPGDCANPAAWEKLVLHPDQLTSIRKLLPSLKERLPRSAMIRTLRLMLAASPQDAAAHRLVQRGYASVVQCAAESDGGAADLNELWRHLYPPDYLGDRQFTKEPSAEDIPAWIKLLELWDYARAPRAATNGGTPATNKETAA